MHLFKTSATAPVPVRVHRGDGLKKTKFAELVGGAVTHALVWPCAVVLRRAS